jgi:hypothetical protein
VQHYFNYLEELVVNETYTYVSYYDYESQEVLILRDNQSLFAILYLVMLKYVFGYNIKDYTALETLTHKVNPLLQREGDGCFELIYYENGRTEKFLTKYLSIPHIELLRKVKKPQTSIVFGVINDTYDITNFLNEHLSSFNTLTALTLQDVLHIIKMKYKKTLERMEGNFLRYLDDNVFEEKTIYKIDTELVLY